MVNTLTSIRSSTSICNFKKITSKTFGFQLCQTHTNQSPFERRRQARRGPRVFERTHIKHPSSAGEPCAFSNEHISSTLRAEASPTHFSAYMYQPPFGGKRSELHAFSNAHTPSTFRAQGASEGSPTCFQRTHTDHPSTDHPSSADGRAKRAPRLAQRTHVKRVYMLLQLCSPCISLGNPSSLKQRK